MNERSVVGGAGLHVVYGKAAGVLGAPVSEEELRRLTLQSLLAIFNRRARLVHHQTNARRLGEVVL